MLSTRKSYIFKNFHSKMLILLMNGVNGYNNTMYLFYLNLLYLYYIYLNTLHSCHNKILPVVGRNLRWLYFSKKRTVLGKFHIYRAFLLSTVHSPCATVWLELKKRAMAFWFKLSRMDFRASNKTWNRGGITRREDSHRVEDLNISC